MNESGGFCGTTTARLPERPSQLVVDVHHDGQRLLVSLESADPDMTEGGQPDIVGPDWQSRRSSKPSC